jgi:hypothetical protein
VYGSDNQDLTMNAADFRRIALSLQGVEEGSHMGAADFRVGGKIFATLASQDQGYGNLKLTPEQQVDFVRELPEVFLPIPGGWGRMGMTHIRLAKASEDVLAGALRTAWKLRIETNAKKGRKKRSAPTWMNSCNSSSANTWSESSSRVPYHFLPVQDLCNASHALLRDSYW